MITMIASLAGFISALMPALIKMLREFYDRKHELAIMDRQIQMNSQGLTSLDEIRLASSAIESSALYKTYSTGITWIDTFNGTVRPALAYAFFLLYGCIKWIQCTYVDDSMMVLPLAFDILWSVEDQAIFASIISFYFGQRAIRNIIRK